MKERILATLVCVICLSFSLPMMAGLGQRSRVVDFAPFPKAADGYWRKQVPREMRLDYVRLGNQYIGKPWNAIPDSIFAEFRTNGNRTNYEALSFGIRTQFACLVMAEIMEHRGRFISSICQGLHYFMEKEPWWGIPAHYPKSCPERATQPVDLFNAETSSMLAWTLYMLGNEIDRKEKGLCDSVRSEIEYRFLNPTLYDKQGWKENANNWNTWITSNWIETTLLCEQNVQKRADAIKGAHQCLLTFLGGYPDDGGCEEGVGYWDRAGASFFESLYFLQSLPEEEQLVLDDTQRRKVEAMGKFITTMHIDDLTFVNFSDAQARNVPNVNILFPYGEYLGNQPMMELAAYVGQKYHFTTKPSELFLMSGNYPTLGRELMLLSMLPKFLATAAVQPRTESAYLANSQIMVASTPQWFVAAKGGHNAESHNHNDVGNFIIYHAQQPVVIDLGRDTYSSLTFSNRRFELMNNRSAYHNVPLVNRQEQMAGKAYRAMAVSHADSGGRASLHLDLAKAYPEEAYIDAWERSIVLDRQQNQVEITEEYQADSLATEIAMSLICYGEPVIRSAGSILLQEGKVRLEFDAGQLSATIEKLQMADGIMKTQWRDNVFRILLKLQRSLRQGKIQYRFVEEN